MLVDATASLRNAGFATLLARAARRNEARLAGTRIGVGQAGARKTITLPPGPDRTRVVAEVRRLLGVPNEDIYDVYAPLCASAAALATSKGERQVVLVTLENGDAENDLEAPCRRGPRGTRLAGADGPFMDLPWGWLFQRERGSRVLVNPRTLREARRS